MNKVMPLLLAATFALGCDASDELTVVEAALAIDEAGAAGSTDGLVAVSVDLSTDFTIGEGVQRAVETLQEFVASQVSCSTITVAGTRVTMDFGELGDCAYQGETYAGKVSWAVVSATPEKILVTHTWDNFHNSKTSLTGSADVTWDLQSKTRRVEHTADWTHKQRSFTGTGDRTQSLLDEAAGLLAGLRINGWRSWTSDRGKWHLTVNDVDVKWEYALPIAGSYVLTNPDGKELTVTFSKLDEDTIRATVTGTKTTFQFNVSRTGQTEVQTQ